MRYYRTTKAQGLLLVEYGMHVIPLNKECKKASLRLVFFVNRLRDEPLLRANLMQAIKLVFFLPPFLLISMRPILQKVTKTQNTLLMALLPAIHIQQTQHH